MIAIFKRSVYRTKLNKLFEQLLQNSFLIKTTEKDNNNGKRGKNARSE